MLWLVMGACLLLSEPPSSAVGSQGLRHLAVGAGSIADDAGVCTVNGSGVLSCLGTSGPGVELDVKQVWGGAGGFCAVRWDETATCWGDSDLSGEAPAGQWRDMAIGHHHACAAELTGETQCWGDNGDGRAEPDEGGHAAVAAGYDSSCGIEEDGGHIQCWGNMGSQDDPPTSGGWQDIASSFSANCASDERGDVACWGTGVYIGDIAAPSTDLFELVGGQGHFCGLTANGVAECFGDNAHWQSTPPADVFVELGAADNLSCGLTAADEVVCWGEGADKLPL